MAEAFYLTGEIEKYGSGFIRIREAIAGYPTMVLTVKEAAGGFSAQLQYQQQRISETTTQTTDGGVNGGVNELLQLIQSSPGVQISEVMQKLKVSRRSIERWLKQLREQGIIEFRGAPKTGGYYMKASREIGD